MKNIIFLLFCGLNASVSSCQTKKISVNQYDFIVSTSAFENAYGTVDTVSEISRIVRDESLLLIKFYPYQDDGSDCNNEFWSRELLEISGDQLIINTHYFQKTGMDPIPDWRKRIFQVDDTGELSLIFDKYKYDYDSEWRDEY